MQNLKKRLAEASERRTRRKYLKEYGSPARAEKARNYIEKGIVMEEEWPRPPANKGH